MLLGGWEAKSVPNWTEVLSPTAPWLRLRVKRLCEKSSPNGSKGANRLLSPRIQCKRCFHPPAANLCQNAQNIHNVNTRGGGLKKRHGFGEKGKAGAVWRDLIGRGAFSGGRNRGFRRHVSDSTFYFSNRKGALAQVNLKPSEFFA